MLHDPLRFTLDRARRALVAPLLVVALGSTGALAQSPDAVLDPVVVTATRQAQRSFDLPASIDTIERATLEHGQPMVNLSEVLVRIPGIVAQNRQNYAQDLQISSRGFGARAAFGVRGLRLYQDDIPQTMPDGQGQTGSFQLLSTERIEVLRGPFSTLYGNASGGVISVVTESGTPRPVVTVNAGAGSYDAWTFGAKLTGTAGDLGYVVAANRFETDGYRDHSAAERTLSVAKLTMPLGSRTRLMLLATGQEQPESQDPLGLTRAQWEADPRQAVAATSVFDTRKTVRQYQGGARLDHAFGDVWSLRATAYGGKRDILQYLAFPGDGPTASGGVVDLDRTYAGASVKLLARTRVLGGAFDFTAGVDYDEQEEHRRGYVNERGVRGDLRRDEDDSVRNADVYAQVQWQFHPQWSATAGVRSSDVRFRSDDHYVTAANPDDSGRASFTRTTPVGGLVFHATENVNLYATYGEGFETPTFAELAYRPGTTGLNLDLRAATSRAFEAGAKMLFARHRLNVALFAIDTRDEIVIDAATGGRTTFRNAGRTKRRGAELIYDGDLGYGVSVHAAYTWLDAEFDDAFETGSPPTLVPAGSKLPGVPSQTGYAELAWTPPSLA